MMVRWPSWNGSGGHFYHLERGGFLSKRSSLWTEYYGDESALKELQELVESSTPVTLINREVLLRLITRTAISQSD